MIYLSTQLFTRKFWYAISMFSWFSDKFDRTIGISILILGKKELITLTRVCQSEISNMTRKRSILYTQMKY